MNRSTAFICKLFTIITPLPALAQEVRKLSIPLELTGGLPLVYISTQAPTRTGTTYSLAGFSAEYMQFFLPDLALFLQYESHLNSLQGARLLGGPSAGIGYFLLGNAGYETQSPQTSATVNSRWRIALVPRVAQRSYDFESLDTRTAEEKGPTANPYATNKGDFWGWTMGVLCDYPLGTSGRAGAMVSYFQTLGKDRTGLSISSMTLMLRYTAFIRMGSPPIP